ICTPSTKKRKLFSRGSIPAKAAIAQRHAASPRIHDRFFMATSASGASSLALPPRSDPCLLAVSGVKGPSEKQDQAGVFAYQEEKEEFLCAKRYGSLPFSESPSRSSRRHPQTSRRRTRSRPIRSKRALARSSALATSVRPRWSTCVRLTTSTNSG